MFGLYMLAIYLGIAIIVAGVVALLVIIMLAVGLVTHPHARPGVPQARRAGRRSGVDPRVDRLVLDRSRQAGLHPVLLGLHRRDRRIHHHPRLRRMGARTAHQGRTPSHETSSRAGNQWHVDVATGIMNLATGIRKEEHDGQPRAITAHPIPSRRTNRS